MASQAIDLTQTTDRKCRVTVLLRSNNHDLDRVLDLGGERIHLDLGRASKTPRKDMTPGVDNGWVDSPIVSREHARLSLNEQEKRIYLEDRASTHGTYINGRRLRKDHAEPLSPGDRITLGQSIHSGPEIFRPTKFEFKTRWAYHLDKVGSYTAIAASLRPPPSIIPTPEESPAKVATSRTYSVPNDTDPDEGYSDDPSIIIKHASRSGKAKPRTPEVTPPSMENHPARQAPGVELSPLLDTPLVNKYLTAFEVDSSDEEPESVPITFSKAAERSSLTSRRSASRARTEDSHAAQKSAQGSRTGAEPASMKVTLTSDHLPSSPEYIPSSPSYPSYAEARPAADNDHQQPYTELANNLVENTEQVLSPDQAAFEKPTPQSFEFEPNAPVYQMQLASSGFSYSTDTGESEFEVLPSKPRRLPSLRLMSEDGYSIPSPVRYTDALQNEIDGLGGGAEISDDFLAQVATARRNAGIEENFDREDSDEEDYQPSQSSLLESTDISSSLASQAGSTNLIDETGSVNGSQERSSPLQRDVKADREPVTEDITQAPKQDSPKPRFITRTLDAQSCSSSGDELESDSEAEEQISDEVIYVGERRSHQPLFSRVAEIRSSELPPQNGRYETPAAQQDGDAADLGELRTRGHRRAYDSISENLVNASDQIDSLFNDDAAIPLSPRAYYASMANTTYTQGPFVDSQPASSVGRYSRSQNFPPVTKPQPPNCDLTYTPYNGGDQLVHIQMGRFPTEANNDCSNPSKYKTALSSLPESCGISPSQSRKSTKVQISDIVNNDTSDVEPLTQSASRRFRAPSVHQPKESAQEPFDGVGLFKEPGSRKRKVNEMSSRSSDPNELFAEMSRIDDFEYMLGVSSSLASLDPISKEDTDFIDYVPEIIHDAQPQSPLLPVFETADISSQLQTLRPAELAGAEEAPAVKRAKANDGSAVAKTASGETTVITSSRSGSRRTLLKTFVTGALAGAVTVLGAAAALLATVPLEVQEEAMREL